MAMNKRKTTTVIVAGVTAVALLLGGTFAWTSISQTAKNEAIVDINPGGRLHDDFNGTNKDVYVENFGDDKTGVPIFARIRLDQYFEVGQDAGTNKDGTARKVNKILGDETDINSVDTWVTYKPGETIADTSKVQANANWQWNLGRTQAEDGDLPYYMPTFNMNKDSLAADINGTYEGTTDGDIVHYDDYVQYGSADQAAADTNIVNTEEGTEVYDWDDEDTEEETDPIITEDDTTPRDSADVYHKSKVTNEDGTESNLTHTAEQISTDATVVTMKEWIDAGSNPGNFWVYDIDGWAYWANPIQPGETTGLLLDSINMSRVPDDNWYYGINVVAQFATAGDIQAFNSGLTDDETWTSDAEDLFAKITGTEDIVISAANLGTDMYVIGAGGTPVTYTATRTVAGVAAANQPTFTWTATDANGAAIDGVGFYSTNRLSVDDSVPGGTEITLTATAGDLEKSIVVTVLPGDLTMSYSYDNGSETTTGGSSILYNYGRFYTLATTRIANNDGDKVSFTFNFEIDWEKTLARDYSSRGMTLAQADNALEVTFSGLPLNVSTGDTALVGSFSPSSTIKVYPADESLMNIPLDLYVGETIYNVSEQVTMTYIRDGGEAQPLTEDTVLQNGDVLVMSVPDGVTVANDKTVYTYVFEGTSSTTTKNIISLSESVVDNTRQYTVTVLDGVTEQKTVRIKSYFPLLFDGETDSDYSRNEFTVKVDPNTTAE